MVRAVLVFSMLCCLVPAQGEKDPMLQAFYYEAGVRDFAKAHAAYLNAARAAGGDQKKRAQALTGAARCAMNLGRADEARKLFRDALALDPMNEEARTGARGETAQDEQQLEARVARLIQRLGGPDREIAVRDLKLIGKVAIPRLEKALASSEPGRVSGAAKVLRGLGREGWVALARALQKEDLPLPRALLADFSRYGQYGGNPGVELARVAIRHDSPHVRRKAHEWASTAWRQHQRPSDEVRSALQDIATRLLSDPDQDLVREILTSSPPLHLRTPEMERRVERHALEGEGEITRWALQWINIGLGNRKTPAPPAETQRALQRRAVARLEAAETSAALQELTGILENFRTDWTPEVSRRFTDHVLRAAPGREDSSLELEVRRDLIQRASRSLTPNRANASLLRDEDVNRLLRVALPLDDGSDVLVSSWRSFRQSAFAHWKKTLEPQAFIARLREQFQAAPDDGLRRIILDHWTRFEVPPVEILAHAAACDDFAIRRYVYDIMQQRREKPITIALPHAEKDLLTLSKRSTGSFDRIVAALAQRHGVNVRSDPSLKIRFPDTVPSMEALTRAFDVPDGGSRRHRELVRLAASAHGREALPLLEQGLRDRHTRSPRIDCAALIRLVLKEEAFSLLMQRSVEQSDGWFVMRSLRGKWSELSETDRAFAARWLREIPARLLVDKHLRLAQALNTRLEKEILLRTVRYAKDERTSTISNGLLSRAVERITSQEMRNLIPEVVSLLDHPANNVRKIVRESLEELQQARRLRAGFDAEAQQRRTRAIRDATRMLQHEDPIKRRGGVLALAALGAVEKVPEILHLLGDPDPDVQESALKALERLGDRPKR